jgi:hypothetical protein|tara:strand:- start:10 stop:243 length:234 start_codon:yes stop_codon:yes gene_type:complete
MMENLTKSRYRALETVAEHLSPPSREMRLEAIIKDIPEEDLRWVVDKLHYFILKILEDAEVDPAEDDFDVLSPGLTD